MTLHTAVNRVQYIGNGLAVNFPAPFPVPQPEHLRLFLWDGRAQTELTGGFTVVGAGTAAVFVVFDQPPAAGAIITLLRQVPLVQPMDLANGGAFNAEILEGSADNLEMQIQQLQEEVGRAIVAPESFAEGEVTYETLTGLADQALAAGQAAEEAAQAAQAAQSAAEEAEAGAEAALASTPWGGEITQAGYEALPPAEKQANKIRMITDLSWDWPAWAVGGTASWGGITGTLSAQTDLHTALTGLGTSVAAEASARQAALAAEVTAREAGDASTLAAALSYTDNIVSRGNLENFDPDMGIGSPNWEAGVTYQPGAGVNHHYRGFTALTENTGSEPYEGSVDWALEAEDFVVGGAYVAWGAGTGASGGRGFIVVDGYGLYCVEHTTLTQDNLDAIHAAVNALPFPAVFPAVFPDDLPQIGVWRVLYGWPQNGRYQVYFYSDGSLRWVDPGAMLGLVDEVDPAGGAPVRSSGIAAYVEQRAAALLNTIYPVGVIIAFAGQSDPNALFAPQVWEKTPHQTFLRGVTGAPGGAGGSNFVTEVISHTHTLGAITVPSAGTHKHSLRRDLSSDGGYLPQNAPPGSIIAGTVNAQGMNGTFTDRTGADWNNGGQLMTSEGAHTHAIAAGTAVPAPAGAVASLNNQPAYLDVVFWRRMS